MTAVCGVLRTVHAQLARPSQVRVIDTWSHFSNVGLGLVQRKRTRCAITRGLALHDLRARPQSCREPSRTTWTHVRGTLTARRARALHFCCFRTQSELASAPPCVVGTRLDASRPTLRGKRFQVTARALLTRNTPRGSARSHRGFRVSFRAREPPISRPNQCQECAFPPRFALPSISCASATPRVD